MENCVIGIIRWGHNSFDIKILSKPCVAARAKTPLLNLFHCPMSPLKMGYCLMSNFTLDVKDDDTYAGGDVDVVGKGAEVTDVVGTPTVAIDFK